MNLLEQYLLRIDESSFDCEDFKTIKTELEEVCKQLFDEGESDIAKIANLESQSFSVQKSFDTNLDIENGTIFGLSWQLKGTQTLEDGSQVPLYWPDVTKFTQQEFEYFEKRYKECKNLFAKTEYGLIAYFGHKTDYSKHQDFKRKLCIELLQLSKNYYIKAMVGNVNKFYLMDFYRTVRLSFGIAEKEKAHAELSVIIQYLFEIHQNWDITKDGTLRILLDLSGLMSEYFGLFSKHIDFQKIVDKNLEGAKELEKTYIWGAIYALDRNLNIEQKRNRPALEILLLKAKLYEKMAYSEESKSNIACVGFAEDALRLYQQIGDLENLDRLKKYYSDLRGKFSLTEFRQNLSKEHQDLITKRILKAVAENNNIEILHHFIRTPWYESLERIKEQSTELSKQSILLSLLSTSIVDKFGNTVEVFNTEEEKVKYNFWNAYSYNFQIGTSTMLQFFIEAYKGGKLNYNLVLKYLEGTWFNEVIIRRYHGQTVKVKPIDTLKPGLKRMFDEIDISFKDVEYQCDFVTVIDSLTLKIEGLLRYFCERIGIATFKTKQKGADKLVMEKLLDDLLADVEHKPALKPDQVTNFLEEDRIFIKYVLTEKAGLNLRNEVAHGLMDIFEYSFEHVIVLFCIILKLSKYTIVETK